MKTSEVIKKLQQLMDKDGDLNLLVYAWGGYGKPEKATIYVECLNDDGIKNIVIGE